MASLLNMSGRALVEKLPYDAEIEYLESDGTNNYITIANKLYDFDVQFYVPQGQRNAVMGFVKQGAIIERCNSTFPVISIIINGKRFNSDVQIYGLHTVSYKNGDVLIDGIYKKNIPNNQEIDTVILFGAYNVTNYIQRIYSLKLYEQSNTIMFLIPVRVGNVGYMYDKVSKQLFGNEGTGSFILGPDK